MPTLIEQQEARFTEAQALIIDAARDVINRQVDQSRTKVLQAVDLLAKNTFKPGDLSSPPPTANTLKDRMVKNPHPESQELLPELLERLGYTTLANQLRRLTTGATPTEGLPAAETMRQYIEIIADSGLQRDFMDGRGLQLLANAAIEQGPLQTYD